MKQKILTLQTLYREGQIQLKDSGIEEYQLDAWYLLEYVTGISKASYYGDPNRELSAAQAEEYRKCIEKRSERIPLQHITGVQEFMGHEFFVNEHVLIPRQDTEILVEHALDKVEDGKKVLDMCTGSGCILLSILKRYQVQGTGADISSEALQVAERNRKHLALPQVEWLQSDLFEKIEEKYDVIVSNPPYIQTGVIESLQEEVRLHDPYIALDGKEDGLYFYRRIIEDAKAYLEDGGWLLFEIGYDQAEAVSMLMQTQGYEEIEVIRDLAGLDRVVKGKRKQEELHV